MKAVNSTNGLTLDEATAILRCWNFGGNVTDRLHANALAVWQAAQPVAVHCYRTVSSDEDDERAVAAMAERAWLRVADESLLRER